MKCESSSKQCMRANPRDCEHACYVRVRIVRPSTPVGWSDTYWIKALDRERQRGWDECMAAWAEHMKGMARAMRP